MKTCCHHVHLSTELLNGSLVATIEIGILDIDRSLNGQMLWRVSFNLGRNIRELRGSPLAPKEVGWLNPDKAGTKVQLYVGQELEYWKRAGDDPRDWTRIEKRS